MTQRMMQEAVDERAGACSSAASVLKKERVAMPAKAAMKIVGFTRRLPTKRTKRDATRKPTVSAMDAGIFSARSCANASASEIPCGAVTQWGADGVSVTMAGGGAEGTWGWSGGSAERESSYLGHIQARARQEAHRARRCVEHHGKADGAEDPTTGQQTESPHPATACVGLVGNKAYSCWFVCSLTFHDPSAMPPPRRALLVYSGRWRGDGSFDSIAASHSAHLIQPLTRMGFDVHVSFATSLSQWMCSPSPAMVRKCNASASAANAAFYTEIMHAFGGTMAVRLATTIYAEPNLTSVGKGMVEAAAGCLLATTRGTRPVCTALRSREYAKQMRSVVAQWTGLQHAYHHALRVFPYLQKQPAAPGEANREDDGDGDTTQLLILRARMDVRLTADLSLPSGVHLDPRAVLAEPEPLSTPSNYMPRWKDFTVLFASLHCFHAMTLPLTSGSSPALAFNMSTRCQGFCPEEQLELLLQRAGCRMHAFGRARGEHTKSTVYSPHAALVGQWRLRGDVCGRPPPPVEQC